MRAGFSPSDANRAPNRCQISRSAALQPVPRVHPPEPGRLHAVHTVPERIPLTPSSPFRAACCSAARPAAATRGLSRIAPLARRRISPPGALSILCHGHAPDIALRLQGMLALQRGRQYRGNSRLRDRSVSSSAYCPSLYRGQSRPIPSLTRMAAMSLPSSRRQTPMLWSLSRIRLRRLRQRPEAVSEHLHRGTCTWSRIGTPDTTRASPSRTWSTPPI